MPQLRIHANDAEAFLAKFGQPTRSENAREYAILVYNELPDGAKKAAEKANECRLALGDPPRKVLTYSTDDEGEVTLQFDESGLAAAKAAEEAEEKETASSKPASSAKDLPEWTLKSTPEEYLERYPKGPSAALAKKHVKAAA